MSRRNERTLERKKPELANMVRCAKGDVTARGAVDDAEQEEGLRPGGDLLAQRFEVGKAYWMETAIWVYVGRVVCVGIDYIEIAEAARIHVDGRHHVMMETGTAENIEIETTGGPQRRMRIPIDWIGPNCEWPHPLPDRSV